MPRWMVPPFPSSPPDATSFEAGFGVPSVERDELWREAIGLWLAWNRGHEQVTAALFLSRHDPEKMTDWLDQLEQLRWRAIELSESLMGR